MESGPPRRWRTLPRSTRGSARAVPPAGSRRTAARWRRPGSPGLGTFHEIEELGGVVQAQAGSECPEGARLDPEGRGACPLSACRESDPQALIQDGLERLARATRFGPELGGDIFVEGDGGSHASDVNSNASRCQ